MQETQELTVDDAIKIAKQRVTDEKALAYLNSIPEAIEAGADSCEYTALESLKIQILYALNNMKSWKGDEARLVKKVLRKFSKIEQCQQLIF